MLHGMETPGSGPETSHEPSGLVLSRVKACIEQLNRLDLLLIAAAKTHSSAPSQSQIFEAFSEAGIACADAVDVFTDKPISPAVREVAITDFAVTLKTYHKLVV
jgi:hypothetical protein